MRLWRDKRGEEEATINPGMLILAVLLILFFVGLGVVMFQKAFYPEPKRSEVYSTANFRRLTNELDTMLEDGTPLFESRVIPFNLYGSGSRYLLIASDPNIGDIEAQECRINGCCDVEFNDICKQKPCICLCEEDDCTNQDLCKAYDGVRFLGLGFGNNNERSAGNDIAAADPLHMGHPFRQLILTSYCNHLSAGSTPGRYAHNLYIEETKNQETGGRTYIILARDDSHTQLRADAIETILEARDYEHHRGDGRH